MSFPTFDDLVAICRPVTQDRLDALCRKAETGEQWAEICRLEAMRTGMFVLHNCAGCRDGERPCREGGPRQCSWPRARND